MCIAMGYIIHMEKQLKGGYKVTETEKIRNIAINNDLTGQEYKIYFLLLGQEYTRAMICKEFNLSRNTISTVTKKLLNKGLIKESKIEGRNIFLTACTNVASAASDYLENHQLILDFVGGESNGQA